MVFVPHQPMTDAALGLGLRAAAGRAAGRPGRCGVDRAAGRGDRASRAGRCRCSSPVWGTRRLLDRLLPAATERHRPRGRPLGGRGPRRVEPVRRRAARARPVGAAVELRGAARTSRWRRAGSSAAAAGERSAVRAPGPGVVCRDRRAGRRGDHPDGCRVAGVAFVVLAFGSTVRQRLAVIGRGAVAATAVVAAGAHRPGRPDQRPGGDRGLRGARRARRRRRRFAARPRRHLGRNGDAAHALRRAGPARHARGGRRARGRRPAAPPQCPQFVSPARGPGAGRVPARRARRPARRRLGPALGGAHAAGGRACCATGRSGCCPSSWSRCWPPGRRWPGWPRSARPAAVVAVAAALFLPVAGPARRAGHLARPARAGDLSGRLERGQPDRQPRAARGRARPAVRRLPAVPLGPGRERARSGTALAAARDRGRRSAGRVGPRAVGRGPPGRLAAPAGRRVRQRVVRGGRGPAAGGRHRMGVGRTRHARAAAARPAGAVPAPRGRGGRRSTGSRAGSAPSIRPGPAGWRSSVSTSSWRRWSRSPGWRCWSRWPCPPRVLATLGDDEESRRTTWAGSSR